MSNEQPGQILSWDEMRAARAALKESASVVVFTNGCFDILHRGHVEYLEFARAQGDALIVGVNSDDSVRRSKGPSRPINPEGDRARVLSSLRAVDYVVVFDDDEPLPLITALIPDVLVKGSDWAHYVSGREVVEAHGGKVVLADLVEGRSTTSTIDRILHAYDPGPRAA